VAEQFDAAMPLPGASTFVRPAPRFPSAWRAAGVLMSVDRREAAQE
jgi:hypothetical protein